MSGDVRGCQGMSGDVTGRYGMSGDVRGSQGYVRGCQGMSGDVRGCQGKLIQQSPKSSIQANFRIRVLKSSKTSWQISYNNCVNICVA